MTFNNKLSSWIQFVSSPYAAPEQYGINRHETNYFSASARPSDYWTLSNSELTIRTGVGITRQKTNSLPAYLAALDKSFSFLVVSWRMGWYYIYDSWSVLKIKFLFSLPVSGSSFKLGVTKLEGNNPIPLWFSPFHQLASLHNKKKGILTHMKIELWC